MTHSVNPPSNLANSVQYYVETDAGIVKDTSLNPCLAVGGKAVWVFTTGTYPLTNVGSLERTTRFGFFKINSNFTGSCACQVAQNSDGSGSVATIGWQSDGFVDKTAIALGLLEQQMAMSF